VSPAADGAAVLVTVIDWNQFLMLDLV